MLSKTKDFIATPYHFQKLTWCKNYINLWHSKIPGKLQSDQNLVTHVLSKKIGACLQLL